MKTHPKFTPGDQVSVGKAIKVARDLVRVIHHANDDFVVQKFDGRDTSESCHMDHCRSQAWAKEARIEVALEQLGIDDAGAEANRLCQEEGRWDTLVRDFIKQSK